MKSYDQKEIDDLKTYIKNIIVNMTIDDPQCGSASAFYRNSEVYFCVKDVEPKMKNKMMMVLVHEIKHAIVDYIEKKRMVPIIPDDIKTNVNITVNPAIQIHSQFTFQLFSICFSAVCRATEPIQQRLATNFLRLIS